MHVRNYGLGTILWCPLWIDVLEDGRQVADQLVQVASLVAEARKRGCQGLNARDFGFRGLEFAKGGCELLFESILEVRSTHVV